MTRPCQAEHHQCHREAQRLTATRTRSQSSCWNGSSLPGLPRPSVTSVPSAACIAIQGADPVPRPAVLPLLSWEPGPERPILCLRSPEPGFDPTRATHHTTRKLPPARGPGSGGTSCCPLGARAGGERGASGLGVCGGLVCWEPVGDRPAPWLVSGAGCRRKGGPEIVGFPPSRGGTFQAAGERCEPKSGSGRPRATPSGLGPQDGDGDGWRGCG